MSSDTTVVARYDEAKRAAGEQTLRKLVRKQGILLLILGILFVLMVLAPFVGVVIDGSGVTAAFVLGEIVMLVVPVAIGALGVRQLRRKVHLPEVAVTITPTAVLFPAIERPSALAPRTLAEEWAREGTSAEILPASGLLKATRVVFTRQDGRKRRRRMVAADNIDVDARILVDALSGPRAS